MALKATPQKAAEMAIHSIGLGFDMCSDLRLKFCKQDPCLIDLGRGGVQDVLLPGGIHVSNVPKSIVVDKGERTRYTSDVLSFQQMAEHFNQEMSLSSKIPPGVFNHLFDYHLGWQKDASRTKSLAYDGWFITLYTVALSKSHIELRDHVKEAVPSSWNPSALYRFIKRFGTHIVVGVKMGGKDVVCIKQQQSSTLQPAELQKRLKEMADERFLDMKGGRFDEFYGSDMLGFREQRLRFADSNSSSSYSSKEDIMRFFKRKGGKEDNLLSHSDWLDTVQLHPDVISMSFVPITSLLTGVPGNGFLSHAINLYLRYKPPIEELEQFLEFQLPRQWAPVFSDLPLGPQRRHQSSAYLQFTFLGPKLFVNTNVVDVGKRPVTGLRLFLEGKKGNRLAIHLQHLTSLPQIFKLQEDPNSDLPPEAYDKKYYEPVQWKHFSHVCVAPIESEDELSIVTGAQLFVENHGFKKVLFLRLNFCTVQGAIRLRYDWDTSPGLTQKSGMISTLISTHFSSALQKPPPPPRPEDVVINSAVFPGGPPKSVQAPRLLRVIDTTEMTRGPQDTPGYWVVSGAKLHLERGKISLRVKYSLLTVVPPDEDDD